ncbi:hypothetical protein BDZ97DRAFT_1921837 [Flammula alnicola]|nr:hypothetical protein BDZ97DRAFT_1921837 [Flammula alnicola]
MSKTIIDDQDLSRVKYTGTWARGGSSHEHDGTVASSTNVGDSFSVTFSGSSIAVYGTIDSTSGGVLANYSIDGAPSVQVSSQAGSGDTFNQQFWVSPTLALGKHELIVDMAKINQDAGPGEGTIWFDYFVATDPTIHTDSGNKRTNIGAIVGGVVGGIVMVTSFILLLLFLRRRRRTMRDLARVQPVFWPKSEEHGAHLLKQRRKQCRFTFNTHNAISGFISSRKSTGLRQSLGQDSFPSRSPIHSSSSSSSPSMTIPPLLREGSDRPVGKHQIVSHLPEDDQASLPSTTTPSNPARVQHIDSGVRAINVESIDIPTAALELPPVYSPH